MFYYCLICSISLFYYLVLFSTTQFSSTKMLAKTRLFDILTDCPKVLLCTCVLGRKLKFSEQFLKRFITVKTWK